MRILKFNPKEEIATHLLILAIEASPTKLRRTGLCFTWTLKLKMKLNLNLNFIRVNIH